MMRLMSEPLEFVCRVENTGARLCDKQCRPDRFESASRRRGRCRVLTQDVLEGNREACSIGEHFALIDEALLVLVDELDGSSSVMMCSWRSLLILSIIAASVVDFPLPVGRHEHEAAGNA